MSDKGQKAAITPAAQGIGASLVTAYRRRGWSVVATARAMKPAAPGAVIPSSLTCSCHWQMRRQTPG